jgi:hypothetical protein
MIPTIIKYNVNSNTKNIVKNMTEDSSYFICPNKFSLKSIKIGPFLQKKNLNVEFQDFTLTKFKIDCQKKLETDSKNQHYFILVRIYF